MASGRLKGTVKWFNDVKGFGFITPDDGSDDLFVHMSQIQTNGFPSLADGEPVEFAVSDDEYGRPKAVAVSSPGSRVRVSPLFPSTMASDRLKGTVKWFNEVKGFGFITPDDGSDDLFVHQSQIQTNGSRSLANGEPVEFAVTDDDSGRSKAVAVTGPNGASVLGSIPALRGYRRGGRHTRYRGGADYNCYTVGELSLGDMQTVLDMLKAEGGMTPVDGLVGVGEGFEEAVDHARVARSGACCSGVPDDEVRHMSFDK